MEVMSETEERRLLYFWESFPSPIDLYKNGVMYEAMAYIFFDLETGEKFMQYESNMLTDNEDVSFNIMSLAEKHDILWKIKDGKIERIDADIKVVKADFDERINSRVNEASTPEEIAKATLLAKDGIMLQYGNQFSI